MPYETLLIAVLALPFVGKLPCRAAFRPNARNAEAWLAGAVALIALALVAAGYPRIVNGGVDPTQGGMGAGSRPRLQR